MALITERLNKGQNFYLCFTRIEYDGAFSCHLYDRINKITYMGSDRIKSKKTNYRLFDYEIIIPIREMVFEEIMNMYFVEVISLGINGLLKKYNLDEYAI